jgi:MraZ protein
LGNSFIIAKWYEGCLVVVGKSVWEALLERISPKGSAVTGPVRDTDRFILGSAYQLIPDAQGRIVIPESLANYANLSLEITFLGLGDRVEVWNRQDWEKREKEIASHAAELIEKLADKNDNS